MSPPNVTVLEKSTFVMQVLALDPDHGWIIYSISNLTQREYFRIDHHTGVLSLQNNIDFETGPRFLEVVVSAFDGNFTTDYRIEVHIADVNEPPVLTSSLDVRYFESSIGPITTVNI